MTRWHLPAILDDLLRPRSPAGRVLVTGWFSFLDGEVTAGDALAQRAASQALGHLGIGHDTAWSPVFEPGGLTLDEARPEAYEQVLFVCGPVHGEQIAGLHRRYAGCRRLAVGVSVVDPDGPAARGFHRIVARDGAGGRPSPDLAASAPPRPAPPVAGIALTYGQGEYADRRGHEAVAGVLLPWLAGKDCARVDADTRLAREDPHLCRTADQYMALVARLDVMITDRLHGMVLALRAGVPALVVDPVRGGAKVSAQAKALRWPAVLPCEEVSAGALDDWWSWCLSPGDGAAAARRRRRLLERARAGVPPGGGAGGARR
ncbi:polysaccharide pyruvyl transferase family protein [Streptomyces sp. NPDC005899]|uniref:polysaccharide pyruvyl transferase family protein n=1 Tax=Streptomyces sp. NPDC005899 TaxID=3155716 RepID=UPI0033E79DBC